MRCCCFEGASISVIKKNLGKEANTKSKQEIHIASNFIQQVLIWRQFWGSTSSKKHSRNLFGFVHRHKPRHGTKIWQLGDIGGPTCRAWAPRRKGKGKKHLPLPFLGWRKECFQRERTCNAERKLNRRIVKGDGDWKPKIPHAPDWKSEYSLETECYVSFWLL